MNDAYEHVRETVFEMTPQFTPAFTSGIPLSVAYAARQQEHFETLRYETEGFSFRKRYIFRNNRRLKPVYIVSIGQYTTAALSSSVLYLI